MTNLLLLLAIAGAAVPFALAVVRRPPTGVLFLAALAPFDGILFIIPHPPIVGGWKEALVLLVTFSAWRQRQTASRSTAMACHGRAVVAWAHPMIGLLGLAVLSAALHPSSAAVVGVKIGFFYLLVPLALWWTPLDAKERDRLVTVLMVTGAVVAAIGIGQQIAGPEALVSLGYEYNSNVRFAGGILRSFSTFNQPFAYGFFVMMVLLVGIPVALDDHRRLRNALFLASVPILAIGMVTAVVRASVLGFAIGAAWLLVHRYRVLIHALVPVAVAAVFVPSGFIGAFLSSTSLLERSGGWTQVAFEQRIEPLGQGIGSVGSAAELIQDSRRNSEIQFPTPVGSERYQPDNYYMKTLVELGPIGAWLLIAAMGRGFLNARKVSLRPVRGEAGLAAGIAASILGAMAAALVSSYWEIFPADLFFWMLLGVLPSLYQGSSSTPLLSPREVVAFRPIVGT
ncbi:MAG: O-antigen ligase family protein [Acidimicrobiales bacterium]